PSAREPVRGSGRVDRPRAARLRSERRGQATCRGGGRRGARRAVGDERPRRPWRRNGSRRRSLRARSVDARGRPLAPAHRGRFHHRLARARGRAARRSGPVAHGHVPVGQGSGVGVQMRIGVVGCGAVGSIFAANLARLQDVEIWAYDPWQEHVEAINAHGLRLSGAEDVVGPVRATADPAELPACELGLVATKSMHTDEAIAATAHAFEAGAVCSVQNGAGNEGRIAEFTPTRELAWAVMAEGRAVADAQGIVLDTSPEELFDYAARKEVAYDHKPSMLQDVEAGRRTEVDFLNGAVVSFGERFGV